VSAVQAVIFDLGRVLVSVDLSRGLFPLLLARAPAGRGAVSGGAPEQQLFDAFGSGALSPAQFHERLCRQFDLDLAFDEFARQWCDVFAPMPGMPELLAEVAARLPVGILSDTDPLHWGHVLEHYPWLRAVPNPTLSFRTGLLKPDRGAYLAAAADVGVPPEVCFFTDDLEANVEGARRAGMDALQFSSANATRQALRARGVLS